MLTDAQMRAIALELPDVQEKSHFGHPDFRFNNKIFATLWPGQNRGVLKLSREEQAALALANADVFSIPPGGERGGWTSINLAKVSEDEFRQLIRKAWASLPRPRPRKEVARKRTGAGR